MTIFTNAFLELVPKALGMGGFFLAVAIVSRHNNIKVAERERARLDRMFSGNRQGLSSSTTGDGGA